jgi:tRNA(Ile)-lysidine synthase
MANLVDSVEKAVGKWVPRQASVLVACSGGADSTALAAALAGWQRVSIGHVDHGLRPESAHDASAVRALAQALGMPFHLERLSGLEVRRQGLEGAAREARYPALARLAAHAGASVVVTAHTQRDQAETLLLRLLRGAGPGALAGVRRTRPLAPGISLRRPLLDVPRAATEAYCQAGGLCFVTDPHNSDPRRARARVRALWPLLLELNPRLEQALCATAEACADEDDLLNSLAGGGDLAELHPALQRRALLRQAALAGVRPERQHLEALLALLSKPSGSLDLPGGRAVRSSRGFRFVPGKRPQPPVEVAIEGPGSYSLDDRTLVVGERSMDLRRGTTVDLARAPFPWRLRTRRPGDVFQPASAKVRKVAEWFTSARIPRSERDSLAVLEDAGGRVFYVEGLRPSDALREGDRTAHFLLARK